STRASGMLRRFRGGVIAAALACAALVPSTAYAAAPTTPVLTDVYVSSAGSVTVTWNASIDADGDTVTYTVYRSRAPISATNIGSATAVTDPSVTITSATVPADSSEIAESYVWFYAVRAGDGTSLSLVSKTMAPNLHGYRLSSTAVTCTRCHSVHGAYPDGYDHTDVELCYVCHGTTSPSTAGGAKSSLNIQAEFSDYSGQEPSGSVHRSDKMDTDKTECDACHSAHRSPYFNDDSGTYVPASSFRKMLRVQTGVDAANKPTYTYYSANTDTAENTAFCFACHGDADALKIDYVGDPGDYDATGGDHNESGYAAAAHGPSVVYSNDHGRTDASEYPQVQCLACHDKHASAADKLIAYRGDDTDAASASGTYAEAELCFACHSSISGEDEVAAGYAAPYSWNDRDVEAEFGRTSAHPVSSSITGRSLTCASCHNVHDVAEGGTSAWSLERVSTPSNTKSTPTDMTSFCLDCHDGSPATATITADTLVPYRIGFSDQSASPYFPGWDKSGFDTLGVGETNHYTPATGSQPALCNNCHDPHGSGYARLVAWSSPTGTEKVGTWTPNIGVRENDASADDAVSSEENLCYQCHGNGTTGRSADGALDVATKAGLDYAHDPSDTTGYHADTENGTDIGTTPHAECTDCHDPHMAKADPSGSAVHASNPTADSSAPGTAVYGAWGAVPDYAARTLSNAGTLNWDAPGQADFDSVRLSGAATDMEAYLCFKCHSQNIGTTMIPGLTDTAQEFNPSNFSVHNVTGQSVGMQDAFTNQYAYVTWQLPDADRFLLSGWTTNSSMTCTDCHTNAQDSATQAVGPHGSTVRWLLDPTYGSDWRTTTLVTATANGMSNTTNLCAKCHDLNGQNSTGNWSNVVHAEGNHRPGTAAKADYGQCQNCHTGVPHGWNRPRLLAYTDDGQPYASTRLSGLNPTTSLTQTNDSVTWDKTYCSATCGGAHSDLPQRW
ncbi:MAG: cytochrome c3 family protein, partial [Coriobacteriia bacterium]